MKKIYWRPRAVSRTALTLIAVLAVVGLLLVENLTIIKKRPYFEEKKEAAELAEHAMDQIWYLRSTHGPPIDISTDPTASGLIGLPISPVTTVSGDLTSKQTSVNPNFAAVIVDMLKRAEVKEGDTVAVGVSGSFPAINVCVYAAIEALGLKPIIISSASASQWGANVPELLWIDMERHLQEQQVFGFRSVKSSIGGYEDRGLGLDRESLEKIEAGIERNKLPKVEAETFEENVADRIQTYHTLAGGSPIKAYINVGGGAVSVGRTAGKKMFRPGLNLRPPGRIQQIDGVMARFISEGIPVIHLIQIQDLAERYGLPIAPVTKPEVGVGDVFRGEDYNRLLAGGVLLAITLSLYAFIRSDIGFRLLQSSGRRKDPGHPEPMV